MIYNQLILEGVYTNIQVEKESEELLDVSFSVIIDQWEVISEMLYEEFPSLVGEIDFLEVISFILNNVPVYNSDKCGDKMDYILGVADALSKIIIIYFEEMSFIRGCL